MNKKDLDNEIEQLNDQTKLVDTYGFSERATLQKHLDKIASELNEHPDSNYYLLFEAQARLHLIGGNYADADKFCQEAIRLNGSNYPNGKFLLNRINAEQSKARAAEREIHTLKSQNGKYGGLLILAAFSLIIFVPMYLSAHSLNNQQADMINTCSSAIEDIISTLSDANDAVSSMNDSLNTISNDASSAAFTDYDSQAYALDSISSDASNAQNSDDFTGTSPECTQVSTGSE